MTTDVLFPYTKLILNFATAGTSAADTSTRGRSLPRTGNAVVSADANGVLSGAFDGNGDWFSTTDNLEDFAFGTGAFEVEIAFATSAANAVALVDFYTTANTGCWQLYLDAPDAYGNSGVEWWSSNALGVRILSGSSNPRDGKIHFAAVSRDSLGVLRLFFDGEIVASAVDTRDYTGGVTRLSIGAQTVTRNAAYDLNGRVYGVRITKGYARHTQDYIPALPFAEQLGAHSSISFPAQLSVPDRNGYTESFEDTRSAVEMEIGTVRRRNRFRKPPRLFDLQWTFTQAEFQVFDIWWQDTIKGGAEEFDIRLLDADKTIVWYTVTVREEYKAEVVNELEWRVTMQVKALAENFGQTRPAGTDTLAGVTRVGVSAQGALLIARTLRGKTDLGVTATARFSLPAMRGLAEVGMFRLPRARFGAFPLTGVTAVGVSGSAKLGDVYLRSAATVGVTARGNLQVGP